VRSFLADINRLRGTTILITSHDMDDIEALCSRVMIIDHGRLGYDGSLAALVHNVRPRKRVRATYDSPVDLGDLPDGVALETPNGDDGSGQVIALEVDRERLGDILALLPRLGPLLDLEVTDTDIAEIIREIFVSGIASNGEAAP
jgi:ABC-2 type transport system ATP-binding protein